MDRLTWKKMATFKFLGQEIDVNALITEISNLNEGIEKLSEELHKASSERKKLIQMKKGLEMKLEQVTGWKGHQPPPKKEKKR